MKYTLLLIALSLVLLLTGCSGKTKSVVMNFEGSSTEQKWALRDLNPELPSDWSSYGFLTFELNSSTPQRFDLMIYDREGIRRVSIHPFQNAWVRASVPLIHFQERNTRGMDMAAISKSARPGYWIGFSASVGSIRSVDSLGFAIRQPVGSPTLEIRDVRLTMAPEDTIFGPVPLVDEFGQWIPGNWEGKARSVDDLKAAWDEEDRTLGTEDLGVSGYGGFTEFKIRPSGFFRVEKIDNKWWFVDPDGCLFFSAGSTCINSRSEIARLNGREYIFKALPPDETDPYRQNQEVNRDPSLYTWNLYRRFGQEWYDKWMDLTFRRINSWGLNTIGNWSDPALGESQRVPYVATLRGWGIETGIMGMPDVYAPDYEAMVDEAALRQCAPLQNDPYLLGYFLGNEPPWPGRELEFVHAILSGPEAPMQTELKKYLAAEDTPERRKLFVYDTYSKFIGIINKAVRKHDPNHLNLGMRYGGSAPEELIKASAGFDVFSLNIYGYSADHDILQKISDLTGLPIIIGEFHFGTPARGLAPGLAQTINHEERGVAYSYYVENAAAHSALIGTHWFQWIDQPSTGRFDGENYNIGFVDVTDRPYQDMVDAARETFKRLYDIHSGKLAPTDRKALIW